MPGLLPGICEFRIPGPGPVSLSNACDVVGRRYTHLQEQVTKQTYQVAALQKALQRTQDEVLTDTHSRIYCESVHAHKRYCLHDCGYVFCWLSTSLPVCQSAYKLNHTVSAIED